MLEVAEASLTDVVVDGSLLVGVLAALLGACWWVCWLCRWELAGGCVGRVAACVPPRVSHVAALFNVSAQSWSVTKAQRGQMLAQATGHYLWHGVLPCTWQRPGMAQVGAYGGAAQGLSCRDVCCAQGLSCRDMESAEEPRWPTLTDGPVAEGF